MGKLFFEQKDLLNDLKKDGWTIELDCLIQPNEGAAVVGLASELMESLSNLHINLVIRFWD